MSYLQALGWKNHFGGWNAKEIAIDLAVITLMIAVAVVGGYWFGGLR